MLTWGIRKLSTCRPQARALFKPAALIESRRPAQYRRR